MQLAGITLNTIARRRIEGIYIYYFALLFHFLGWWILSGDCSNSN